MFVASYKCGKRVETSGICPNEVFICLDFAAGFPLSMCASFFFCGCCGGVEVIVFAAVVRVQPLLRHLDHNNTTRVGKQCQTLVHDL